LVSMVERAALIDGSLKITSRPNGGTHIEIRAPLPASTSSSSAPPAAVR
jgi:nitrate/nitrite-specific signal transduction histidine kinase